jgi:hypothetical protein
MILDWVGSLNPQWGFIPPPSIHKHAKNCSPGLGVKLRRYQAILISGTNGHETKATHGDMFAGLLDLLLSKLASSTRHSRRQRPGDAAPD